MPVSETVEAAYLLEDRIGVELGPVVVNCYEDPSPALGTAAAEAAREAGVTLDAAALAALDEARAFRRTRQEVVDEQVDRLARELPLPQLRLPRLIHEAITPKELAVLARAFEDGVAALPAAVPALPTVVPGGLAAGPAHRAPTP